jgi:Leucine-rich repeat (LRR) protein
MKNVIIAVLAAVIILLGSWLVYDRTTVNKTAAPGTSSSRSYGANTLNESGTHLTAVGSGIYNQAALTSLDLSYNSLKTLPSQMGRMTNLQVLKLDHNQLDGSLIAEIRLMPLTTLDVSYNNMTGMPAEIGQLNKLVTLNYSYNKITGLPNELANLKNNLKTFNLTGNPLSQGTIDTLRTALPNTNIIF